MPVLLDDDDVRARLSATDAVRWMGEAVDAHHRGDLVAPPRIQAKLGEGRLTFTAGRLRGSWFGYRSYDSLPGEPGSQVVVVHDDGTGEVRAVSIGTELGRRRTGAIGGVAAAALAPPEAAVVAVIGAGDQAYTQVWALAAVRRLADVRVYSRRPAHRDAFATAIAALTGAECRAVSDPRRAVDGAEIVVLATSSPTPVIEAAWLPPRCYVATLGAKQQGRAEFGLDLPAAAGLLVTDSRPQISAYDPPNLLVGTGHEERLVPLGAVRAGEVPAASDGITVFFSVGLAGTEVFLLHRLVGGA